MLFYFPGIKKETKFLYKIFLIQNSHDFDIFVITDIRFYGNGYTMPATRKLG